MKNVIKKIRDLFKGKRGKDNLHQGKCEAPILYPDWLFWIAIANSRRF
ncbi:MAG: hypothetical protein P9L98_01615 [Candidatus Kaelpia imicola]|nr:hypothetical protein [Candidatus Kaelpia imicola]